MTILMMFRRREAWLVEANVSGKHAVSIFRAEVSPEGTWLTLALMMETARFPETLASINQSTGLLNPKEHHQNIIAMFQCICVC
jgi:hypothetical protein